MDRQRLADALAYEQERRKRLARVVPMPADGLLRRSVVQTGEV